MEPGIQTPKTILTVLNQLYELERKLKKLDDQANLTRNIGKMKDAFAEEGLPPLGAVGGQRRICFAYEDPMGQPFKETRTDLEATISGSGTENLVVVEVIKPIIRAIVKDSAGEFSKIVQKGVVIVESRKEQQSHVRND
jgi:hypothetical protein